MTKTRGTPVTWTLWAGDLQTVKLKKIILHIFPLLRQKLRILRYKVWKLQKKVAFNIASEASYVYILSGQKLIKNAKMVHFDEFLKTWSFRSNSVTRQLSFNRSKIGGKCQNSNATFWVIFKHCEYIIIHDLPKTMKIFWCYEIPKINEAIFLKLFYSK